MQQLGVFVAIALALAGCDQSSVQDVQETVQKHAGGLADGVSEAAGKLGKLTGDKLDEGIEAACGLQVDADINKVETTMKATLERDCGKKKSDEEKKSCKQDGEEGITKTLTSQRQGMLDGCKDAVKAAPGDYQNALSDWSKGSTEEIQQSVQDKVTEIVGEFSIAEAPLLISKGTGASAPLMVGFAALASITSMGVVFAWRRATSSAFADGAEELLPTISESDAA